MHADSRGWVQRISASIGVHRRFLPAVVRLKTDSEPGEAAVGGLHRRPAAARQRAAAVEIQLLAPGEPLRYKYLQVSAVMRILLVALFLLSPAPRLEACSCGGPGTPSQAAGQSAAAFAGTVIEITL